jgi:hypothetical protein
MSAWSNHLTDVSYWRQVAVLVFLIVRWQEKSWHDRYATPRRKIEAARANGGSADWRLYPRQEKMTDRQTLEEIRQAALKRGFVHVDDDMMVTILRFVAINGGN